MGRPPKRPHPADPASDPPPPTKKGMPNASPKPTTTNPTLDKPTLLALMQRQSPTPAGTTTANNGAPAGGDEHQAGLREQIASARSELAHNQRILQQKRKDLETMQNLGNEKPVDQFTEEKAMFEALEAMLKLAKSI